MKKKILAAFLLAFAAIGSAVTVTHFSFREMMGTVDQLSEPNEKLVKLNRLFEEITMLDQQQRAEAIRNPQKPYKYFLDQSGFLHMMIDSLKMLPWDTTQLQRLSAMSQVLDQRNQIFVSYLKVKAELSDNRDFSHQLDTLAMLLKQNQRNTDSIVTTQRKTITQYLRQDSLQATATKDRGFLKRIFGKKKEKTTAPPVKVEEKTDIIVDTLAIAHSPVDIKQFEKLIYDLEVDQRSQRKKLQNKELDLIHANSLFINELLDILHDVESEELANMRASNDRAALVFNRGISRMSVILLAFFLGAAVLVYFILIDIARSNYYRKQLEAARDHAEELSKIKQRFLANMSHEIRTPLQSIIGFAEQLKTAQPKDDAVSAIHSSSEHLLQIVNEVLDYSRISSGQFSLMKENFRVLDIVKEVEAAMRVQAEKKQLTFVLDAEKSNNLTLQGDSFRLRQILYNLLGNAIKFTQKGFIKLTVTTTPKASSTICTFEVTDSGIGMTTDEVQKIFNQFEQANKDITKQFGGTGLGLTIVKSLVEVQGGSIDVTSQPGVGTTFKVVLSFDSAAEVDIARKTNGFDGQANATAAKVLVVDDDELILKLCALILKKNSIPHTTYNDPHELLNKAVDTQVTHIFVDIRMPKMNGAQLCEMLRERYPEKTKIIALTAHVLPEERDSLLKRGFNGVLPKPFYESDLLQALGLVKNTMASPMPDFNEVKKMTLGDEALFHSIIQQFVEESQSDLERIRFEAASKNKKAVREIVHRLAGRCGQMGIHTLSGQFHEIEVDLVQGQGLSDVLPMLEEAVHDTETLLYTIRMAGTVSLS